MDPQNLSDEQTTPLAELDAAWCERNGLAEWGADQ